MSKSIPSPKKRSMAVRIGGALVALVTPTVLLVASPVNAEPDAAEGKGDKAVLPAPPQMKALEPLLGKWKCVLTNPPPPVGGPQTVSYVTTRKALDGHYLYSDVTLQPGDLVGRQIFGWNPISHKYTRYSYDNWGTSDYTVAGAPDKNGKISFVGSGHEVMVPSPTGKAQGFAMTMVDNYTFVRPGYRVVSTVVTSADGNTVDWGGNCTRISK